MSEQQSYRQIMKSTSLFGGVQIFNIIIQIIRSKFVAVLLGPAGMGIMGLLTSTISIVGSLTNFGLATSAVKDIAAAHSSGDIGRMSIIVATFKRLTWITGILGTVVTLILSSWLSKLTFGNSDYTLAFVIISSTLLFNQLNSGHLVLLQGMRKLNYLARANLIGTSLSLLLTVPMYYLWGINGIVPVIVTSSIIVLIASSFYSQKASISIVVISISTMLAEGRGMLRIGLLISLSGILGTCFSYIIRIFISRSGGVADVGLYNAGFSIVNTYVGLIFTAMATDYYPRLSAVAHDNKLCKLIINQQAEIAILILAPIIVAFLGFINWIIYILYSDKFLPVNDMVYWAAMGMFFKTASWAIAFVFLAKSDSKIYFWNELLANVYIFVFNIVGYKLMGLTGLGISFAISYLVYFIQVYIICRRRYGFDFNKAFIKIFLFQFSLALGTFFAIYVLPKPYPYFVSFILISFSIWISFMELDKRLELFKILSDMNAKFFKK
jgi:O-antigen/teichoic acid export membrane protein